MGGDPFGFGGAGSPFADIFESFFGGGAQAASAAQAPPRGGDIQVGVDLDFEEAVFGAEKKSRSTASKPAKSVMAPA